VGEDDAVRWAISEAASQQIRLTEDAARELVDALGAEMLTLGSELSKLVLYAQSQRSPSIELADVETMVSAAKQRSLYELTDAISAKDAPRAVALLHGLLNASETGEDAAIGHVFSLAKTFRQMLVLNEKQVRDQRAIWQVLWPGFRVAPFAADALITQARRYRDRSELTHGIEMIARADAELRSNPADKRLVLERLVLRLAGRGSSEPQPTAG
jgi:DNA polymerase-3 subunit delta